MMLLPHRETVEADRMEDQVDSARTEEIEVTYRMPLLDRHGQPA